MHLLTAESTDTFGGKAAVLSWIKSLDAPILSRIMSGPSSTGERHPQNASAAKVKRQLEFRNGRRCAESLLKRLGTTEQVLVNDDRSPAWPIRFAGSISHSKNWIWAVVAEQNQLVSVGIDTEPIIDQKTREEIILEIVTPSEWEACRDSDLTPDQIFSIVFSAKEAFYKCCYPIVKQYFGFEHAVVESIEAGRVKLRTHETHPCFEKMPASLNVFFCLTPDDVFTIVLMEAN